MRKNIVLLLLIILTLILQTTLGTLFSGSLVTPNLLLILVISIGFMRGKATGLVNGLICGLLADVFSSGLFGFHALVYMHLGYFSGAMYQVFFDEDVRGPMIMAGVGDLICNVLNYFASVIQHGRFSFWVALRSTIIPEALLTVLFTLLLYKLYHAVNKRTAAWEREAESSPWLRR